MTMTDLAFVLGQLDSWEWDSGARDMSPVPKSMVQEGKSLEKYTEDELKVSVESFAWGIEGIIYQFYVCEMAPHKTNIGQSDLD